MVKTAGKPHAWMTWLALLALAAGAGAGLAALAAPAGIWSGQWQYRTGFAILGAVTPWSGRIAAASLLLAVILGTLAGIWKTGNGVKLAGFALIGAVCAGIAWYVPNSFRPPAGQSYPSIHDISTDTGNPPRFVKVLPLRAGAANTAEYGRSKDMTPEKLARLQHQAYPYIRPLHLDAGPEAVFKRALAAVRTMGWKLVDADSNAGRIEATATTFWFRFRDDIVIRVRADGEGTRLDARSVSRVGKGDVGTNARRLRKFLDIMQD